MVKVDKVAAHARNPDRPRELVTNWPPAGTNAKERIGEKLKSEELRERKEVQEKESRTVIFNHRLQFRIHEETRRVMVQIIDTCSGEVLEEIPPEKLLDLVAAIQELAGLLVDKKV